MHFVNIGLNSFWSRKGTERKVIAQSKSFYINNTECVNSLWIWVHEHSLSGNSGLVALESLNIIVPQNVV